MTSFGQATNPFPSSNCTSTKKVVFRSGRSSALHRLVEVSAVPRASRPSGQVEVGSPFGHPLTMRGSFMSTQRRTISLKRLAAAILFAGAFALTAAAQRNKGTITGTVTDPNGAVVKDAKVTATNVATGESRAATTGDEGAYTLAAPRPGRAQAEITG